LNHVIETIKNRRSTRKFLEEPIREDELSAILEAGIYAPSGGNNQTSHLLVFQNQIVLNELKQLVEQEFSKIEIYEGMYKSLQGSISASKKGGYDFSYHAPTLVVIANKKGYGNAMADSVCILENMMIAAESLSVGSCYINQLHWLDENPVIHEFLKQQGLEEDETVCCSLALGYSDMKKQSPLKRTGNRITYIR
jgi:nitroreductase